MINVDRFRCQRLAGEINIVRARTTKSAARSPGTRDGGGRAEIQNMQRAIRCLRCDRAKSQQSSSQKAEDILGVVHVRISRPDITRSEPSCYFSVGSKM